MISVVIIVDGGKHPPGAHKTLPERYGYFYLVWVPQQGLPSAICQSSAGPVWAVRKL